MLIVVQVFSCEVEVNRTLIVSEFDPELQPIGYALALELPGVSAFGGSSERMLTAVRPASDRFGWEFDTAA
jgi:hypothetical protein